MSRRRLTIYGLLSSGLVAGFLLLVNQPAGKSGAAGDAVQVVALPSNDIVYDPLTDRIYASVPSTADQHGNTITAVNPHTGELGSSVFVGSEPSTMAISDDGQDIYAVLRGANAVRRFDVPSETADLQFSISDPPTRADDIAVMPGNRHAVAISRADICCQSHDGVVIYDDGVARPTISASYPDSNAITFGADATKLYGYDNISSGFEFNRLAVTDSGVTVQDTTYGLISGYYVKIKFGGGRVYATSGQVVDPSTRTQAGTFAASGPLAVDSSAGRTFFVTSQAGNGWLVQAFDQATFTRIGSVPIPGASGTIHSLIRWGTDGLAFDTDGGQIFIINTSLVTGTPKPSPTSTVTPIPMNTPNATPPVLPLLGDVDCDGNVTSLDALMVLQYQASLIATLPCISNADVNRDGFVSATDALLILQIGAGLIRPL